MARPNLQVSIIFYYFSYNLAQRRKRMTSGVYMFKFRIHDSGYCLSPKLLLLIVAFLKSYAFQMTLYVKFCFLRLPLLLIFITKFNLIFICRNIVFVSVFMFCEIKHLGDNICCCLCKMDIVLCSYFCHYHDSTIMLMISSQLQYVCFKPRIMESIVINFLSNSF
jgi:hypothetical protein